MLEYNFSELDNDFITLWSRYLITDDASLISADLEKLAELGQINAIQKYYFFMERAGIAETNSTIDKRVEDNTFSKNFNQTLAEAYKIFAKERNKGHVQELVERAREQKEKLKEIEVEARPYMGDLGHFHFADLDELRQFQEKYDETKANREKTLDEIRMDRGVQKEIEAINICKEHANNTKNPLVLERYLELFFELVSAKTFEINRRDLNRKLARVQKELARRYKANPDTQTAFALAKNMYFFAKKDKNKQLANDILKNLAERPLSKTLNEYTLQGDATLPKTTNKFYHSNDQLEK